jgi:hypothetical protein
MGLILLVELLMSLTSYNSILSPIIMGMKIMNTNDERKITLEDL